MEAGIYIWMPAGMYGWMLRPRDRGIYPQMRPPALGVRYHPGAQAEHDGDRTAVPYAFRSDSTCSPSLLQRLT